MSKYYFHAVLLKNCKYSNAASELLNNNNIKNQVQIVNSSNKEKFKLKNYKTFPQIFLKKEDSKESLFLGGYSDLNDFVKTFKNQSYDEKNILEFKNKYNWWSKKAILRSIELIN